MSLRALVLYGSRARGDQLTESDYDLVVISDDFGDLNPIERRLRLYEAWDEARPAKAADIFGFTSGEILAMRSPVMWDMLEDGRPVHDSGVWRQAVEEFRRRKALGQIVPVKGGWKVAQPL